MVFCKHRRKASGALRGVRALFAYNIGVFKDKDSDEIKDIGGHVFVSIKTVFLNKSTDKVMTCTASEYSESTCTIFSKAGRR